MKVKIIVLLSAWLLSVSTFSQTLIGVWKNVEADSIGIITESLSLHEDGTMQSHVRMDIYVNIPQENINDTLSMAISCNGTWQARDQILTQTLDTKSMTTEVVKAPGNVPKFVLKMLTKTATSQIQQGMKKAMEEPIGSHIDQLTSTELVLTDLDDPKSKQTVYQR